MFSAGFLTYDDHCVAVVRADQLASGMSLPVSHQRLFLFPWLLSLVMTAARAVGVTAPATEMLLVIASSSAVSGQRHDATGVIVAQYAYRYVPPVYYLGDRLGQLVNPGHDRARTAVVSAIGAPGR